MKYSRMLAMCLFLTAFLVSGCSHIKNLDFGFKESKINRDSRLIELNYRAARILNQKLQKNRIKESPMLVSTFVNLDNIDSANSLGRLVPQQISSKLTQLGYQPIDIRLRSRDILVREKKGELALSRKIEDISLQQSGRTILVGTYSFLNQKIFVTVKILRCRDSATLAAHDYVLPYKKDTDIKPSVLTDYM